MEHISLKVSPERWNEAQAWERSFWLQGNSFLIATPLRRLKNLVRRVLGRPTVDLGDGDDWNQWWKERFDDYAVVPRELERVVELGCGPYTNIRLISAGRAFSEIHCSDPLANTYAKFRGRWLSKAVRAGAVILDSHPIEECVYPDRWFDLVVLINVLDHVRDVPRCAEQILRIIKPGGLLIAGQELFSAEDHRRAVDEGIGATPNEDPGHPIRLDMEQLEDLLFCRFEPLFSRVLSREEGRVPEAHYATCLYIGRLLPSSVDRRDKN